MLTAVLFAAVMALIPLVGVPAASAVAPASGGPCPKTVDAHATGGWSCFDPVVKTDVQRKNDLVSAGTLSATAAALSQGYCTYQGCWTIVDSAHETFRGSVYYFYGSTQLGQVTLTANVLLNVYTIRTLPFASLSSRGTRTTVLVGDRLYVSDYYPGGNTESFGAYRQQTSCSARGSGISCAWIPSTGYSTRETTVQKVTMLSETTWSDPSSAYPGHWHFWAKSVEADRATNGTGYHFGVLTLPVTPASAGWTAT